MTGTTRKLKDYSEMVAELVLPIGGKKYPIPPVGYTDGLLLTGVLIDHDEKDLKTFEDMSTDDVYRIYLGEILDEMVEDGVGYEAIVRAVKAAQAAFLIDADAGMTLWETGDLPPGAARAGNRATRRQAAKTARGSTNTAKANTTVKRASGPATSSRRKS